MKHLTATCFTVLFALALLMNGMGGAAAQATSCTGSYLCPEVEQSDCVEAYRKIKPGNNYFTDGSRGPTGTCSGQCRLSVQGPDCRLKGQQMKDDFNTLRNAGCEKCGIYTYEGGDLDGCQFKADFVNRCGRVIISK